MRRQKSWQRLDIAPRAKDLAMANNALAAFEHHVWECQRRHIRVRVALEERSEFVSVWKSMKAKTPKSECDLDTGVMELENRLAFADSEAEHDELLCNIAAARDCVLPFPNFQEYVMLVRELKDALNRLTNILTAYVWALEPGSYQLCHIACCEKRAPLLTIPPSAARARDIIADVRSGVTKGLKYLPHNVCSRVYFGFCHESLNALAADNPCKLFLDDVFVLQTLSCFFRPRSTSPEMSTLHKIKDLVTACWVTRKPTFWRKEWIGKGKSGCPLYWSERPGKTDLPGSSKMRMRSQVTAGRAVFGYACRGRYRETTCPTDLLEACKAARDSSFFVL